MAIRTNCKFIRTTFGALPDAQVFRFIIPRPDITAEVLGGISCKAGKCNYYDMHSALRNIKNPGRAVRVCIG